MDMSSVDRVQGPNLTLRLIEPEDTAYVHGLRTDPAYNRHLSEVRGTVETQRKWIEGYKARESDGHELYYVIERKDGTRCGLVRLYEIEKAHFTWGSWILDENKPPKAALESAVLSFGVGFDALGCDLAYVVVGVENTHAEAFYRRFGMSETHRTAQEIYFEYHRARFEADRKQYQVVINSPAAKE